MVFTEETKINEEDLSKKQRQLFFAAFVAFCKSRRCVANFHSCNWLSSWADLDFGIWKFLAASKRMSNRMSGAILMLIVQTCFAAIAQGESPSMIGRWNVEIIFVDGNKRLLRFDVQDSGKGTFLLLDPMLSRWGPAKPSEAKWTSEDQNSVTFSGAVEFPIGNVGRDAGTLTFKGTFEAPDVITGEVDFAPLVGDRPTRHGTFKATRSKN
jgi:hypothetical protein